MLESAKKWYGEQRQMQRNFTFVAEVIFYFNAGRSVSEVREVFYNRHLDLALDGRSSAYSALRQYLTADKIISDVFAALNRDKKLVQNAKSFAKEVARKYTEYYRKTPLHTEAARDAYLCYALALLDLRLKGEAEETAVDILIEDVNDTMEQSPEFGPLDALKWTQDIEFIADTVWKLRIERKDQVEVNRRKLHDMMTEETLRWYRIETGAIQRDEERAA